MTDAANDLPCRYDTAACRDGKCRQSGVCLEARRREIAAMGAHRAESPAEKEQARDGD